MKSIYQSGKSESACSTLRKLYKSKSHPEYEAVRWYYGLCLLSLNEKEDAINIFQEIVDSKQNYQKSKSTSILEALE